MNTFSKFRIIVFIALVFLLNNNSFAKNPPLNEDGRILKPSYTIDLREDCKQPEKQTDQQINNVRARLLTGGDCWWDFTSGDGKYIVPKTGPGEPEVSSIFAGAVWIGGLDPAGNLKLAAVNYRNGGQTDFYNGPIDPITGTTDLPICEDWDQFFKVYSREIEAHNNRWDIARSKGETIDCDSIPLNVKVWPGKGNPYFLEFYEFELPNTGQGLGSFWDEDGDGEYDPCKGDFPIIDIRGCEADNRKQAKELVPDEMIFWIYNDIGGPHTLSQGTPIQMEVQVQAFAFASNDQINDMTFQRYKLINRATSDIRNCYFGMWVDADLGCSEDDFIGSDVERSFGYYYNEDAEDGNNGTSCTGGVNTYGTDIPALGIDYFRGPLSPQVIVGAGEGKKHVIQLADDIANFDYSIGDTIYIRNFSLDDVGQHEIDISIELGMSSFTYHNRQTGGHPAATIDPNVDVEFYNLLQGLWRDGTAVTFGDDGYTPGSRDTVKYVFPDPPAKNNGWSMCEEDLPFGDRRTLQATGPFLLQPQAVNELIVGAVWVPSFDYPCPDLTRLFFADDIAQSLFDNCFKIQDGPDAPDMSIIELDRELILVLTNDTIISNNKFEAYQEKDIKPVVEGADDEYFFEGYQIYQLKNSGVSVQELDDITKARLVDQVDIKNDVATLFNWTQVLDDPTPLDLTIWQASKKVEGNNKGVKHTFKVTNDLFAQGGDNRLVNHKEYYFIVLAYAYNNWEDFNPTFDFGRGIGQTQPYFPGRRNIRVTAGVPRPIVYNSLNAAYGDGVKITRLSGVGTGKDFIDMTDDMYDKILEGSTEELITYKENAGPFEVIIYNPLEVKNGRYQLEVVGDFEEGKECAIAESSNWILTNLDTDEKLTSSSTLDVFNEQLINEYGFSLGMGQVTAPGVDLDKVNGVIGASIEPENPGAFPWLFGVADGFNVGPFFPDLYNFVPTGIGEAFEKFDPFGAYGTFTQESFGFAPFFMTNYSQSDFVVSPGWKEGGSSLRSRTSLKDLNNVDIVLTSDKTKWSRCIVVETGYDAYGDSGYQNIGEARQFQLRASPSVGKEMGSNGKAIPDGTGDGMGWFPGYAVDVETGKRLNIFFGENSYYNDSNKEFFHDSIAVGNDMMWNPSSDIFVGDQTQQPTIWNFTTGANHHIYVTRTEYDECTALKEKMTDSYRKIRDALKLITWSAMPVRTTDENGDPTPMLSYADGLIPNDLKIKLRVNNQYGKETISDFKSNLSKCNAIGELPVYEFEISGSEAVAVTGDDVLVALENVNVVPNPYYAFSDYETDRIGQEIKITNVPDRANVTIYSIDGNFIREFKRDERPSAIGTANPGINFRQTNPDIIWDLKNSEGIPIASGVYLIHIIDLDSGEETTIKWFGINRKFDPSGL